MPVRTSEANWKGDLKHGQGTVHLGSGAWEGQYNFSSRFESGKGSNPEELLAAAHAGCFSMALSAGLSGAGFTVESIHTAAKVKVELVGAGFEITGIELITEANIPGIDKETFDKIAAATKEGCPVSKALKAVPIRLDAKLV
ncbi:OsmC family protein [Kaistia dalseonensis]|uniref:Osmotically inducible protein OsmC n=1 Tax=Kaistia dalseonensis TaxID=410840 RepID=A0ABU0H1G2_9HYPH|nr:OsmC family protein [Kaistia dalseonensis]MCX5493587.1 OsmC family protein [Kaistia dalseonensis]MDQ0436147.1 osmotically inducible protein OsmC [Kaistia dalseonensis]